MQEKKENEITKNFTVCAAQLIRTPRVNYKCEDLSEGLNGHMISQKVH